MTPQEALDTIASRLEAYEASIANLPNSMSPEMSEALDVLDSFIKQVEEHGSPDLEWGEPGSCQARLDNDTDITDMVGNGLTPEEFDRIATERGLGRHYGVPHCIWCLQAS